MAINRSTTTTSTKVDEAATAKIRGLFAEAQKLYGPGGGYMEGIEASLTRGRGKAVSSGMQNLAAAGLAGTSMMGGLALKYEEDVAAPARGRAETQRLSALSSLFAQEASAEASLAQRFTTQETASYSPNRIAPTRIAPTQQRRVAATQRVQPATSRKAAPTLRAFPSLSGAAKKQSTGYMGAFYGADYYKKKAAAPVPSASSLMQQADVYNISGRYFD